MENERDALAKRVEELEERLRTDHEFYSKTLRAEQEAYNMLRRSVGDVIGITGLAERRAGRAK